MRAHVFVDESKDRGFIVAAASVLSGDLVGARRQISALILPRQRRLHFKRESDARRCQIVKVILDLAVQVTIYDGAGIRSEKEARRACLGWLVDDLADAAATRLVLERDDSVIEFDRRLLYQQTRVAGVSHSLRYDHMRAHEECLLAIPDAVAWCWAKGGSWRTKIRPLVVNVRRVEPG